MDLWTSLDRLNKVWGLLSAAGAVGLLARWLRRPGVYVDVDTDPSTLPPGLLQGTRDLAEVAQALAEAASAAPGEHVQEWEDLKGSPAIQIVSNYDRYRSYRGEIDRLRLRVRNVSGNSAQGIRIYIEPRYGSSPAVKPVWGTEIKGSFLTPDQVKLFRDGVHYEPNFVFPELPVLPSKSEVEIAVWGVVDQTLQVKAECKETKCRVTYTLKVSATALGKAYVFLSQEPWLALWFAISAIVLVLTVFGNLMAKR